MRMRVFVIFLLCLSLLACQRQKTEAEKTIYESVQETEPIKSRSLDTEKAVNDGAKPTLKPFKALPISCPKDAQRLDDGTRCDCNGDILSSKDALSGWICALDKWLCYAKEGCKHGDRLCGFGGQLKANACVCGEQKVKETQLGDYFCRNSYWVCSNPSGCMANDADCRYDETCFKPSDTCDKTPLNLDLANYRCENRKWVCRHSKGCQCGDLRIEHGEHCLKGQAYCGTFKKPDTGNYRCDGICDLSETQASYRWICEDENGCPCDGERCGFGAYCNDGQCACGVDAAPQDLKGYLCHYDPNSETHAWLCTNALGCPCGQENCALGEACIDGGCQSRAVGFPEDRQTYVHQAYGDNRWLCDRPEGCPCKANLCAKLQSCIDGRCSCQSDVDCSQSKCENGFCSTENIDCNDQEPPKTPGYVCDNDRWLCDSVHDCICGGLPCARGAKCIDGQCLCGDFNVMTSSRQPNIICKDDRWICQWGALCGGQFCPTDAECRHEVPHCGNSQVEQTQGYRCEETDNGDAWVCDAEVCWCGDDLCPENSICRDGQCLCGTNAIQDKPEVLLQASNYTCLNDQWQCNREDCKLCGGRICSAGARCVNDQCQCGQRASELPKDMTQYICRDGTWICQDDVCDCGDGQCGRYGKCANGACLCGNTAAPEHPENYICDFLDDIWVCNHPSACKIGDKRCQIGEGLVDGICTKRKDVDEFLRMEENANRHIGDVRVLKRGKVSAYEPGDICAGPRGIGSQELCVDHCPGYCNAEEAPRFEGYVCDGLGWVCEKPICACGETACSKGNYCIAESYCSKY